jgi:hypothetical protein
VAGWWYGTIIESVSFKSADRPGDADDRRQEALAMASFQENSEDKQPREQQAEPSKNENCNLKRRQLSIRSRGALLAFGSGRH